MLWSEGTLCPCLHSRELIQNPLGRAIRCTRGSAPAGGGPRHAVQPGCREPPPTFCQEQACSSELWKEQWQNAVIFAVTLVSPVCQTVQHSRASNSLLGLCQCADNPKGRLVIRLSWFLHNFVSGSSNPSSLFTSSDRYHKAGSKIPVSFTFGIDTSDFSDVMQSCHSKHSTSISTGEQVFYSSILYNLYQWTCDYATSDILGSVTTFCLWQDQVGLCFWTTSKCEVALHK